jgi:hypothetical protein
MAISIYGLETIKDKLIKLAQSKGWSLSKYIIYVLTKHVEGEHDN